MLFKHSSNFWRTFSFVASHIIKTNLQFLLVFTKCYVIMLCECGVRASSPPSTVAFKIQYQVRMMDEYVCTLLTCSFHFTYIFIYFSLFDLNNRTLSPLAKWTAQSIVMDTICFSILSLTSTISERCFQCFKTRTAKLVHGYYVRASNDFAYELYSLYSSSLLLFFYFFCYFISVFVFCFNIVHYLIVDVLWSVRFADTHTHTHHRLDTLAFMHYHTFCVAAWYPFISLK